MKREYRKHKAPVMMACGCAANATCDGKPSCAIHGSTEVAKKKPSLKGRKAVCADCGKTVDSDWNLPFFQYRADKDTDKYYSGCYGWS